MSPQEKIFLAQLSDVLFHIDVELRNSALKNTSQSTLDVFEVE